MGVFVSLAAVLLNQAGSSLPATIGAGPILGLLALGYVIVYQYRKTMNAA